jgi:hypothetical protein
LGLYLKRNSKNAHTQSHTWLDCDDSGHVLYGSENDVAVLVNGLVRDIVKALACYPNVHEDLCFWIAPRSVGCSLEHDFLLE